MRGDVVAGKIAVMPQRQLTLWNPQLETGGELGTDIEMIDGAAQASRSEIAEAIYLPIKRVSLVHESSVLSRPMLKSQRDAKKFFRDYWQQFPGNEQERFVVACLNTKNRVECVLPITTGTLDASLVHPREVFRPAIIQGASSIIVSHNHPSGDPSASREDHEVTRRLTECGELLGIEVLDHIIHGDGTGLVVSLRVE